jgi:hypothetical protein
VSLAADIAPGHPGLATVLESATQSLLALPVLILGIATAKPLPWGG